MNTDKLSYEFLFLKINENKWNITYNKLSSLDPSNNDLTKEELEYCYLFYFTQDLVQIENTTKSELIDIGWYPDIDINGEYILSQMGIDPKDGLYNWNNPFYEFKTRSLKKLISKIEELTK